MLHIVKEKRHQLVDIIVVFAVEVIRFDTKKKKVCWGGSGCPFFSLPTATLTKSSRRHGYKLN
jgi:hypothetical protein